MTGTTADGTTPPAPGDRCASSAPEVDAIGTGDLEVGTGADAPRVVVGPLLRYVDDRRATVWVETDRPCEVEVLGARERTWGVHGHHYALVVVDGLRPASETPYEVHLDGHRAWPEPGSVLPASVVRTPAPGRPVRLAFGSCRRSGPADARALRALGADALVALAERMAAGERAQWPDALLLLGDQVYADDPSDALRERLRGAHGSGTGGATGSDGAGAARRGGRDTVREEICDFEEYTWLYQEAWGAPVVRWLLSTVPTCMVLDDHDLRDDWNSSASWREEVTGQPWWRARVVGAFASYWVYQHLGNLSPDALEQDAVFRQVREAPDDATRERLLDDMAWHADATPASARWSYRRDLGRTRLLVLDSRCARRLEPGRRAMVDDREWAWFAAEADADVDHLLVGTSLPYLLLHGVHHLEGWDEAVAEGAWGPRWARVAERLRRAVDLEHWAAFRRSFDAMVDVVQRVAARDEAPASVLWLSGDVHCSYVAKARVEGVDPRRTAVHQLVMSPFRNPLGLPVRMVNRLLERPALARALALLARRAGVRDPGVRWSVDEGPWFANGTMTLVLDGRRAVVEVEHARVVGGVQVLDRTLTRQLTPAADAVTTGPQAEQARARALVG